MSERIEIKFASDGVDEQTGEFTGYGAVFGNVDTHGDVIEPGAFKDSLEQWRQRGSLPAMKMMHGTSANPFSGSDLPIGVWKEMREDAKGLRVAGKLSGLNTDRGRYNYALLQDGALNGLSIGFKPARLGRVTSREIKRSLAAVNLFEVSLVPQGSNNQALVDEIKAAEMQPREFRDAMRRYMREHGVEMSRTEAEAFMDGGFKAMVAKRDAGVMLDDDTAAFLRGMAG